MSALSNDESTVFGERLGNIEIELARLVSAFGGQQQLQSPPSQVVEEKESVEMVSAAEMDRSREEQAGLRREIEELKARLEEGGKKKKKWGRLRGVFRKK